MFGVSRRSYEGDPIDHSWQYFHERPAADDGSGETVYATDPEPEGDETTENVPTPADGPEPSENAGQTTISDWRWSA